MKKNILITGSTDGIGKLTAKKLAENGHRIYLHGRNVEKLSNVVSEIKSSSGNDEIKGFVADFSDLKAVKKMAEQVKEEIPQLDVLINNAGVFKSSNPLTKDGFDIRMVVNYLAPFLLTKEIATLMNKDAGPRIINLSSAAQAPVSFEALSKNVRLSDQEAYAQSKLALTMWSFDLAKQLPGIQVIAVNPGSLLNTNMVKEAYGRFWSPADKGANILYDLAVSDAYRGATGKYFDNDNGGFAKAHSDAYNASVIEKLLSSTEKVLATI